MTLPEQSLAGVLRILFSSMTVAEPLVAPDMTLVVRSPMRCICAHRRAAGLVGVWRSIVFTQSGNWGWARGRSYIESISLPLNSIDVTGLADGQVYLRTCVRIMGRDSVSVATDPPSLCVTASAYVRALIRYRNPTYYASKKS